MKKIKYLIMLLMAFIIMPTINAEPVKISEMDPMELYHEDMGYSIFYKADDQLNLIDNANFKMISFDNKVEQLIPLSTELTGNPFSGRKGTGENGAYQYISQYNSIKNINAPIGGIYLSENTITKELNGNEHKFKAINYKYEDNGYVLLFFDLFIDDNFLTTVIYNELTIEEFNNKNTNDIVYKFDNKHFNIIRGLDNKEYFVFCTTFEVENYALTNIIIISDSKALGIIYINSENEINTLTGTNSSKFFYNNKYNYFKIENDKIRFLINEDNNAATLHLKEYDLTINNDELYVEKSDTYTAENENGLNINFELEYNNKTLSVKDFLTTKQKRIINNLKTFDDYEELRSNFIEEDAYCSGKNTFLNDIKKSNGFSLDKEMWSFVLNQAHDNSLPDISPTQQPLQNTNKLTIPSLKSKLGDINPVGNGHENVTISAMAFIKIEETKTPKGLEKINAILPITVFFTYKVDDNGNMHLIQEGYKSYDFMLKYDPNINYDDLEDVFNKLNNNHVIGYGCEDDRNYFNYSCLEVPISYQDAIPNNPNNPNNTCAQYPVLIDKTSEEDLSKKLEIEAYVNGKNKVNVSKNSEVTVSVKLTNTAKTPSYGNKIVSRIPKGLTYVTDSVVKNGVYDEEEGTITWNLEYLDAENTELFTYKVIVPSTANNDTSYATTASVTNSDFDTPIVSEEVIVSLGDAIVNPKTGNNNVLIIIMIIMLSIACFLTLQQNRKIKNF